MSGLSKYSICRANLISNRIDQNLSPTFYETQIEVHPLSHKRYRLLYHIIRGPIQSHYNQFKSRQALRQKRRMHPHFCSACYIQKYLEEIIH
jgi:hypothetical protein